MQRGALKRMGTSFFSVYSFVTPRSARAQTLNCESCNEMLLLSYGHCATLEENLSVGVLKSTSSACCNGFFPHKPFPQAERCRPRQKSVVTRAFPLSVLQILFLSVSRLPNAHATQDHEGKTHDAERVPTAGLRRSDSGSCSVYGWWHPSCGFSALLGTPNHPEVFLLAQAKN
uniref:Uncharacterized protein n=1 Tax=Neospora caninum (strain Liverpool) TaxID=572307 RepID=A0A0F7UFK7_NEOCL|nr:TPA: hypothetical protein BN1204_044835 [Neospora caninum Liverpool]